MSIEETALDCNIIINENELQAPSKSAKYFVWSIALLALFYIAYICYKTWELFSAYNIFPELTTVDWSIFGAVFFTYIFFIVGFLLRKKVAWVIILAYVTAEVTLRSVNIVKYVLSNEVDGNDDGVFIYNDLLLLITGMSLFFLFKKSVRLSFNASTKAKWWSIAIGIVLGLLVALSHFVIALCQAQPL